MQHTPTLATHWPYSVRSYGTQTGTTCANYVQGSCSAATTYAYAQNKCLGQESCEIPGDITIFGGKWPPKLIVCCVRARLLVHVLVLVVSTRYVYSACSATNNGRPVLWNAQVRVDRRRVLTSFAVVNRHLYLKRRGELCGSTQLPSWSGHHSGRFCVLWNARRFVRCGFHDKLVSCTHECGCCYTSL